MSPLGPSSPVARQLSYGDGFSEVPSSPEDIPEEPDVMTLTEDARQISKPPAHLAARFYRSANRRRSSATSSRRNSLTSQHSHHSTGRYRGSCHSNHVAQHLRRASIIEDRKARLADRAAHAEQVRQRAALAKATPKASNCEERALAAQQAREKYIAQVAAACAEEVRRAKKVAEDMKEKKAAEERRCRLEMEEKHAEVERRRMEYKKSTLRRPRTSSLPAAEVKKPTVAVVRLLDETTAARTIQQAWRSRQRRRVLEQYGELNLTIDSISSTSFEEVGMRLSDGEVISKTAKVLDLFGLLDRDQSPATNLTFTRKFLSAFLVLGHPTAVLSKNGPQEQDLVNKSRDLLISFETSVSKLTALNCYKPSRTAIEALSQAHSSFVSTFDAWKAHDASALIETMVMSFAELDAIWQSVKDDTSGEVADDYRQGIRDNQVMLLSKIRKLAGPDRANMLIKKAIRESRRQRRRPSGDTRPRTATQPENAPDPSVSVPSLSESDTQMTDGSTQLPTPTMPSQTLAALFSAMPENRVLVHELALDKDYRLDASPHASLRDDFNRAVCYSMRKGINEGNGDDWIVAMAENIRTKLLRLLKPGSSLHVMISEALDTDHVFQQCRCGTFSYDRFFAFMSDIIPKLCAPFRDAQVRELCEELNRDGDAIDKTFKLLHVIDNMSLDYSNFLLGNMAPTLVREASAYEQRTFARELEAGVLTLERTKRWWKNASINVITEARTNDGVESTNARPTSERIYVQGLVDLAIATSPLSEANVPETLKLDRARLARFRADTLKMVTIGAILLTAKNLLKRDVRSGWKPEAVRMWDALKDAHVSGFLPFPPDSPSNVYTLSPSSSDGSSADQPTNDVPSRILFIIASSFNLPPTTRNVLLSHITRFLTQSFSTTNLSSTRLTDPVLKVLFHKLKSHILTRIAAVSSAEKVRAAREASESLASCGLGEFSTMVAQMVEELGRVKSVDMSAHEVFYERVVREVEEEAGVVLERGGDGEQTR